MTTVLYQRIGDGLCGLGEHACDDNKHWRVQIPIIGGFLDASVHNDTSGLAAVSSVFQVAGAAMLVGGLVAHHWRVPVKPRPMILVPLVSPTGVGISGRF
jgi:hypothetical protein